MIQYLIYTIEDVFQMRADVFLYKSGIAKSRTSAQSYIESGVLYKGKRIDKPSFDIPDDTCPDEITILSPAKYVGRGGLKLEKAIEYFGLDVKEKTVVDLGASTGGFTDCLLKSGASKVYAVDVGHDQLDSSLCSDKRVINLEGTDARTITGQMFTEDISIICSDLSFISQTKVFAAVSDVLTDGGLFVSLIKPQFEAGHIHAKNGIIKDVKIHLSVIHNIIEEAEKYNLYAENFTISPVKGGDGNTEYLILLKKNGKRMVSEENILNTVKSEGKNGRKN